MEWRVSRLDSAGSLFGFTRYPTLSLMRRAFELRLNVTAYDAAYVALAEQLSCSLLTADQRLAAAPTITCAVEVLDP